jgi:ribosome-associated translation inhibitor RaiA
MFVIVPESMKQKIKEKIEELEPQQNQYTHSASIKVSANTDVIKNKLDYEIMYSL